jgi:hypothetical protein
VLLLQVHNGAKLHAFIQPFSDGCPNILRQQVQNNANMPYSWPVVADEFKAALPEIIQKTPGALSVYPNPSDGTFVLEIKDTYGEINAVYFVYDLSGRVVQQGTVTTNKANLSIAQKGVLILEVTCNQNQVHRQRIVVF